ncbi:MAG: hypothetical protein AAGI15_02315 [Pseudomonadota bacterium]
MSYPWLTTQIGYLDQLAALDRVPQALLICGPPGWGQQALAWDFAQKRLALDTELPPQQVAHPDFRWVEPETNVIKIHQVRDLSAFAQGSRQMAPYKVAVVVHAHLLMEQAANALLKTLEEPPPGTVLVLVTEYAAALLPTVRSRCLRVQIEPRTAEARDWLPAMAGDRRSSLAFEYGDAPLAILEAHERGEEALAPALKAGLQGQAEALQASLLAQDAGSVLLRWARYLVAAQAGRSPLTALNTVPQRTLVAFLDE